MLKVSQVAFRLNVVPQTVVLWINRGVATPNGMKQLAAIKAGRSWRITEEALEAFLDANEKPEPAPIKKRVTQSIQKIIDQELRQLKATLNKFKKPLGE